jgi:hypothetical protein
VPACEQEISPLRPIASQEAVLEQPGQRIVRPTTWSRRSSVLVVERDQHRGAADRDLSNIPSRPSACR